APSGTMMFLKVTDRPVQLAQPPRSTSSTTTRNRIASPSWAAIVSAMPSLLPAATAAPSAAPSGQRLLVFQEAEVREFQRFDGDLAGARVEPGDRPFLRHHVVQFPVHDGVAGRVVQRDLAAVRLPLERRVRQPLLDLLGVFARSPGEPDHRVLGVAGEEPAAVAVVPG